MTLQPYIDQLENLSIREKSLVGVTIAVLLASILQVAIIDPRLSSKAVLDSQLTSLKTVSQRMQQQLNSETLTPNKDRQAQLTREIKALESQLQQDTEQLQSQANALVPAAQVPDLLSSLIADQNVELVSLRNLAPISLTQQEASDKVEGAALFQHGFELELSGSYHGLRLYLQAAEQQPWKLIWHAIEFEVQPDGSNLMKLHLQTLSTDNAWLGI